MLASAKFALLNSTEVLQVLQDTILKYCVTNMTVKNKTANRQNIFSDDYIIHSILLIISDM